MIFCKLLAKRTFVFYYSLVVGVSLNFFNYHASAQSFILDEQKSKEIDQYLQDEMKKRHIPGLAVGIYNNGRILTINSYGLADVQNESPVKQQTRFELASIGKQFTASAIMILVQEGKVNFEDEIHKYLPDAPTQWKGIKIRHLLTHTSGLPHMDHGFSGFRKGVVNRNGLNITADMAFRASKADSLTSKPGERFVYSDVGYFLLGLIMQKASGMSYSEFMQKRLFDPAGMVNTYLLDQVTIYPNEARGYTLRKPYELVNVRRVYDFEVPSHYGVHSNIEDMAKWDAILNTEQILTNKSKEAMFSAVSLNNGKLYPYGFGWKTWRIADKAFLQHTGVTGTEIIRAVYDSITVVVLTNLARGTSGNVNSWGMAPQILKMLGFNPFINEKYTSLTGAKMKALSKKDVTALAGTYHSTASPKVHKVYEENGKLYFDKGDGPSQVISLNDGNYLVLGSIHEWLIKELPKKGSVKRIQLYFNGQPNEILEEETKKQPSFLNQTK